MLCSESKYHYKGIFFRCGSCPACLKARGHMWSLRLSHEAKYWSFPCFVTLTYSPEDLPERGSLKRKDVQDFLKRLRMYLKRTLRLPAEIQRLKYYLVGEYGGRTKRPHYHLLFFCNFNPRGIVDKVWGKGHVNYRPLNQATINYLTSYMIKSQTNKELRWASRVLKIEPPFKTQSTGLGLRWAQDNIVRLRKDKYIKVNGFKVPLPRYYRIKLKINFSWDDVTFAPEVQDFYNCPNENHRDPHYLSLKKSYLDYLQRQKELAQIQKLDLLAKQKIKRQK